MKFRLLFFSCFVVLFCFCVMATLQAEELPKPPTLQVKDGDRVYFRVVSAKIESDGQLKYHVKAFEWTDGKDNSCREITVIPTAEIENDGTMKNIDKAECHFQLSSSKSYAFIFYETTTVWRSGKVLGRIDLPTNFREQLQKMIDAEPDDFKKWTFTFKGSKGEETQYDSEITLAFTGIQHLYELKSIEIPKGSVLQDRRKHPRKWGPKLRIYIDQNGKPLLSSGLTATVVAWTVNFPSNESNIWEVREGVDNEYLIRLRDANATIGWEMFLLDRGEIKAEDFRNNDGIIKEKKADQLDPDSELVRFRFAPVKQ